MSRTQWILSGILAVQAVLLLLVAPWSGSTGAAESHVLLPALASFTPTRVEIEESDERSVVLERDGDSWHLGTADGYPVDGGKVENLLESLEEIRVRKPVVSSSRYHAALKVADDDHERRVRIWESDDEAPEVELLVGTSPNYRASHVRIGGQDEVYEASGVSTYELGGQPDSWIDKKFVNVPFEDVTRFKLTNENGSFELARADGQWSVVSPGAPGGKELNGSAVDALVRSVTSLWLNEPAGKLDPALYGTDEPVAVVEIEHVAPEPPAFLTEGQDEDDAGTGDEVAERAPETLTVVLGAAVEDGDGARYATKSGFDYAVTLSKTDAEKLTTEKLADLFPSDD